MPIEIIPFFLQINTNWIDNILNTRIKKLFDINLLRKVLRKYN